MKGLVEIIIFVSPQDRAPVSRGGLPDVSVLAGPGQDVPQGQGAAHGAGPGEALS